MSKASVKLILGSHGSGKSDYLYSRFIHMSRKPDGKVDFDKKLYLVVPEQDTNDKQRLMMKKHLDMGFGAGILNIDVVSFDRIAHNVFDELNIEPNKENVIDDDVKTMILSLVLSKLSEKGELKFCDKLVKRVGFARKLTKAMSEFYAYNVTDDDFDKVMNDKASDIYKDKFHDLKIIFNEFKSVLSDLNFSIKEDKYDLLNKRILDTHIFDDAIIAFDGFTGFTPIQLAIFEKIISVASEVYVAIDLRNPIVIKNFDINENLSKLDVFYLSKKFIKDIAKVSDAKKIDDLLFDGSILEGIIKYEKSGKEDLKLIESSLYSIFDEMSEKRIETEINNIDYYIADNIRDEVLNVTQVIFDLVRNKGYKYNDIKVMVSSIDQYRDTIIKTFSKYNIPLFIDDTESILNSPYIETIRAALDVVNYNFTYESVMRYFSSGLIEKTRDIFEFDRFLVRHGIRGYNRYKNGFDALLSESDVGLRLIKNTYIDPLLMLYEDTHKKGDTNVKTYLSALCGFIDSTMLDDRLDDFVNEITDRESKEVSDKGNNSIEFNKLYYTRIKTIVLYSKDVVSETIKSINILEKYKDEKGISSSDLSIEEFRRLFDVGLVSKGLKSIPYSLDQIVVGDLMRTRFDNPKVEIFLGLNQSLIPAKTSDNNLIDDKVREIFASSVKELSQTTIETALNQRFYIYLALTNPCEKLYLSYSRTSANGESDEKSSVLLMLENLFIEKKNDELATRLIAKKVERDTFKFYNENDILSYVAENMQDVKKFNQKDKEGKNRFEFDDNTKLKIVKAKRLLKYLNSKENENEEYKSLLNQPYRYKDIKLSDKLNADLLKGCKDEFIGSVTTIENYNNCPYKFFMEKLLKLNMNKAYRVYPYDIGNAAHYVFEKLFKDKNILKDDEKTINMKVDKLVDTIFEREDVFNEFNLNDKNYFGANKLEYIKVRLREILHYASIVLIDMSKHSKLKSDEIENNFIYDINKFDGDKDPLFVNGRIDRIDVSDIEGKTYVSIIDYKSGLKFKELNTKEVEKGTNIQLPLYLDYALNEKYAKGDTKAIFTGAFYFWVGEPIIRVEEDISNADIEKEKKGSLGFTGIANSDKDVMSIAFDDIVVEEKSNKVKKVSFSEGYKLASSYMNEDQLNSLIDTMRTKVNDTMKDIKDGVIKANPVKNTVCDYCIYNNICKKNILTYSES